MRSRRSFQNRRSKSCSKSKCRWIDAVSQAYHKQCKGGNIRSQFLTDVERIPDPSQQDPNRKNLLVLDDIMLGPQNSAESYYCRGRHNAVDVIYISQSYFRLPRQTIQENANFFVFFLQDNKNLIHIFNDHCAADNVPLKTFSDFCNQVWTKNAHNFVVIDLTRPVNCGKYRKNLTTYWCPHYDQLTHCNGVPSSV